MHTFMKWKPPSLILNTYHASVINFRAVAWVVSYMINHFAKWNFVIMTNYIHMLQHEINKFNKSTKWIWYVKRSQESSLSISFFRHYSFDRSLCLVCGVPFIGILASYLIMKEESQYATFCILWCRYRI